MKYNNPLPHWLTNIFSKRINEYFDLLLKSVSEEDELSTSASPSDHETINKRNSDWTKSDNWYYNTKPKMKRTSRSLTWKNQSMNGFVIDAVNKDWKENSTCQDIINHWFRQRLNDIEWHFIAWHCYMAVHTMVSQKIAVNGKLCHRQFFHSHR